MAADYIFGVGVNPAGRYSGTEWTPWSNQQSIAGTPMEDVLYGRWASYDNGDQGGEGSMGPDASRANVYFGSSGKPGQGGTLNTYGAENAQIVRDAIRQYYPNATQEQINAAANAAFQSNRSQPYDVTTSPGQIFSGIAGGLGGITPEAQQWLTSNQAGWADRSKQIGSYLAQDDKYRAGNDLRDLAIVGAITAPAWGSMLLGGGASNGGLLAENSFDSGAMANAMGYSPGDAAGGGGLLGATNQPGFTLDQAMLDPTNPASFVPQAAQQGANAAASDLAAYAPTFPTGSSGGGLLDKVGNWAARNPSTVAQLVGGLIGGAASSGGQKGASGPAVSYTGANTFTPPAFAYQRPQFEPYRGGLLFG